MLQTPAGFVPSIDAAAGVAVRRVIVVHRDKILLHATSLALPPAPPAPLAPDSRLALGTWQGVYYEVGLADDDSVPDAGHAWFGLRSLFGVADDEFVGLAARAVQLAEWARTNRYCGVCATPTVRMPGERACKCPACGFTAYPRVSPAMMVLIRKGDAILLARHAQSPYQRFTALAGFLEAGESAEEAVHREVFEEVGLRVHNLQYFGSQSWPFPHSLMIAFTAEYLDGTIRVDENEIAEARWFGPDDAFPDLPPGLSIASALIGAHRPRPR